MRWDDLFADLDAQASALEVAERASEVGERTRIELAAIGWLDRLRAAEGSVLRIETLGGPTIAGVLRRCGADWLLVETDPAREAVVVLGAVRAVHGLARLTAVPGSDGVVQARLTLRIVLRGIARDRSAVRLHLCDGRVEDGTIDRVGADFVELARHAAGEPRRRGEVRDVLLVPLAAIAVISRGAG